MGRKVKTICAMAAAVLLAGCSGDGGAGGAGDEAATSPSATADPSPTLGSELGTLAKPPSKAMDSLEKPIARALQRQITAQGLRLDHLACPKWDGEAPHRMTCEAYLDGVTADVRVRLTKTTTSLNFDAEVMGGVLATANIERQLKADGHANVDCGDTPAYPIVVGSEIVCSVGDGEKKYVVATVLDQSGRKVEISEY